VNMLTKSKKQNTSAKRAPRTNISECPMCLIHAKGDKATQAEITRLRNRVATLEIERDNAQQAAWAANEDVRRIRSGRGI
jgi:hypothetical protein